ncbi:MAG TPA: deoxyribodipyrimidine photo-lyase [Lacipirellulaceae bacterium]|nr:deoxyribodipyrimidine photo-lyase [Lacipirellulaceae bacterium]
MNRPTIVWLRQDLRVADHPALHAAAERPGVIPLFIWAPDEEGAWPAGGATRWWLHHSLASLDEQLQQLGSRLIVRRGPAHQTLRAVIDETGADAVLWCRRYEPAAIARDKQLKATLATAGIRAESFNGSLLHEPWTISTRQGGPFQVFTPFWKSCQAADVERDPLPAPRRLPPPDAWPESLPLNALELLPTIPWDRGFYETWTPGAPAAERRLAAFCAERLAAYKQDRNRVDIEGFSRLSPHLHFGELSPRQAWQAVQQTVAQEPTAAEGAASFLSEVGWREFAHHLLYHFPHTTDRPLREAFEKFPWAGDRSAERQWQRGRTGYPIVDAAMRELWATGFMPNRARMIVASFLTKDLLIPWQQGARWFWDTLVDADLANNTLGWQWTAGCGADAAPYFRVFNPVSQAEQFDPQGDYIRRWVPELGRLEPPWLFKPWEAPNNVLTAAGVRLGDTYPRPIVDHAAAREAALAAFAKIRGS